MGKHHKTKTPAKRRLGSRENVQNAIIGTAAAAGLAILLSHSITQAETPHAEAVAPHVETEQEQFILNALKAGGIVTDESMSLVCLPDEVLGKDEKGRTVQGRVPIDPATDTFVSRLEVSQSACDAVIAYAAAPDRSRPSVGMASAIDVVVHEAEHAETDSRDEAEVSCVAFQKVGAFAIALGANPAEAAALEQQNREVYHNGRPEHYQTAACYDGGPYDADPGQSGVFPQAPPK